MTTEFLTDKYPKAIGVPDRLLWQVGIETPKNGVLDPAFRPDLSGEALVRLVEGIRKLRFFQLSPLERAALDDFEARKFSILGESGKKVDLDKQLSVHANCPIFDLVVVDALEHHLSVKTHRNSPVISDRCRIVGVGLETLKNWGRIMAASSHLIVLGEPAQEIAELIAQHSSESELALIGSQTVRTGVLEQAAVWRV